MNSLFYVYLLVNCFIIFTLVEEISCLLWLLAKGCCFSVYFIAVHYSWCIWLYRVKIFKYCMFSSVCADAFYRYGVQYLLFIFIVQRHKDDV